MDKKKKNIKIIVGVIALAVLASFTIITKRDSYPKKEYSEATVAADLADTYKMLVELDVNMIKANGPRKDWGFEQAFGQKGMPKIFADYFQPNLKIRKHCKYEKGCFAPAYMESDLARNAQYDIDSGKGYYKVLLKDGSSLSVTLIPKSFRYTHSISSNGTSGTEESPLMGHIYIDLNGPKPPNIVGKDLFRFDLFENLGVQPHCRYSISGESTNKRYANKRCTEGGECCTAVLLAGVYDPQKPKMPQSQQVAILKEVYKMLKDFEKKAAAANGHIGNWNAKFRENSSSNEFDWDRNIEFYSEFIAPYLDIETNCAGGTGCFAPKHKYKQDKEYDTALNIDGHNSFGKALLKNGMSFAYLRKAERFEPLIGTIYIDINGLKPPNIVGEDLFSFDVFANDLGIQPTGKYYEDGKTLKKQD